MTTALRAVVRQLVSLFFFLLNAKAWVSPQFRNGSFYNYDYIANGIKFVTLLNARSNQIHLKCTNPCCLRSHWRFPKTYDLGCRVICWFRSILFSQVQSQQRSLPGNLRASHASFSFIEMLLSFADRAFPYWYQKVVQWPWCYRTPCCRPLL